MGDSQGERHSPFESFDVVWASMGAYLYLFGWVYAHSFFGAWGVEPEDLGFDTIWLVVRAGLVLGSIVLLGLVSYRVAGDTTTEVVIMVACISGVLAKTQWELESVSKVLVVVASPTLAIPALAAAQKVFPRPGGKAIRPVIVLAAAVISLLWINHYASRLGERFRERTAIGPGEINFLPLSVLGHSPHIVTIQTRLVEVWSLDGENAGCGVLLRSHDGIHFVYDGAAVYRYPVDGYVLVDLEFRLSTRCDAVGLSPPAVVDAPSGPAASNPD